MNGHWGSADDVKLFEQACAAAVSREELNEAFPAGELEHIYTSELERLSTRPGREHFRTAFEQMPPTLARAILGRAYLANRQSADDEGVRRFFESVELVYDAAREVRYAIYEEALRPEGA